MGTIAQNLARIQSAKADIKAAIEAKGVTVPSNATIDTYDDYVSQISGGGGSSADTAALKGIIDRSITAITIPSDVTSIGNYVFESCASLTSVDMPSGLTSIGQCAFFDCRSLANIDIPTGVTTIGKSAFTQCTSIESVTIPSGVTTINEDTFENCTSLTSITIPSSIRIIGNEAFYSCTSLINIDIPSGIISIGGYAFYACFALTSVTVNATTPPLLGNNAFNNTNNCPIYVPAASVSTYQSASGWSNYASRITAIPS